jgi:hypothetical protein
MSTTNDPCSTTMNELKDTLDKFIDETSWDNSITVNGKNYRKQALKELINRMFVFGNKVARVSHGLCILRDNIMIEEEDIVDATKMVIDSTVTNLLNPHQHNTY